VVTSYKGGDRTAPIFTGDPAGHPLSGLLPEDLAKQIIERVQNSLKTGRTELFESSLPVAGVVRAFEGRVIYSGSDEALVIMRDFTERKQREKALEESERWYRILFNSGDDAVFVHGLSGKGELTRFVDANEVACRKLGYTRQEFLGLLPHQLLAPESARDDETLVQKLKTDKHVLYEATLQSKDGRKLPVAVNSHLIEFNNAATVISFARDLTDRKHVEELQKTTRSIVLAMATIVDVRDPYTAGHQRRVAVLACAIGRELGLPKERIDGLEMAGDIHDIGKIRVPAEILSKPGKLTAPEMEIIRTHAEVGYEILKSIEFPWPVARIVRQHHERLDGSGYPDHLKGDQILLESRIICVADVVEAMSTHRPYRPGLGMDKALAEITEKRGTYYDPAVVDACLRVIRSGFRIE
jgi:PAS domain S-box-containing protein/putative nucleotidyltransferase with HDIG domain